MNTLTSPRVKPLLDHMFIEADRTMAEFRHTRKMLLDKGFQRDSPEYREAARLAHMAVPPETGQLLYMLARARKPSLIVEFGTSFGVSTIHLTAALNDIGSGSLITTEIEPTKVAATKSVMSEVGLDAVVEFREGNALDTLAAGFDPPIDMLFLDGANHLYIDVLTLVEPHLADTALVVADNADTPGYREYVRDHPQFVSAAIDSRVELSLFEGMVPKSRVPKPLFVAVGLQIAS